MFKLNFQHLSQVEEKYSDHFKFGFLSGLYLILLGIISCIHAIFPFFLARVPDRMFAYFLKKATPRITRVTEILKRKNIEQ
jgi:hypothetical protein